MDAITLLKDDHKTVESLFKQFEKAGERAVKTKRQLADQMTASLLAEATTSGDQAGPEKKGDRARPGDHDAPRRRGG